MASLVQRKQGWIDRLVGLGSLTSLLAKVVVFGGEGVVGVRGGGGGDCDRDKIRD